jgi:hypothetical protein
MHRFYCTASFKDFSLNDTVLASIFLACKAEETPRKIMDIVNTYWYLIMTKRGDQDSRFSFSEEVSFFVNLTLEILRK